MPSQVNPTPPPSLCGKYDSTVQLLSALVECPALASLEECVEEAVYLATTDPDAGSRIIKRVADCLMRLESMDEEGREWKSEFVNELADRAVSEFVDFWNGDKYYNAKDDEEDQPHSLLLSLFLGDLFSLGIIRLSLLEKCIEYLIINVRSGEDLLALFMLFSRSSRKQTQENLFGSESLSKSINGMHTPKLNPLFLGHCFILIREVCDTLRRSGVKQYSPWGGVIDPSTFIQEFGELFQSCDSRLRFPGVPPPANYNNYLKEKEIKEGRGRNHSI